MSDLDTYLFLIVAVIGGGIGAVLRLFMERWQGKLPWGILAANIIASFVVGLTGFGHSLLIAMVASIASSLSTFSTFSAHTVDFMRHGRIAQGLLNILFNLGLSSVAFVLGQMVAITLLK